MSRLVVSQKMSAKGEHRLLPTCVSPFLSLSSRRASRATRLLREAREEESVMRNLPTLTLRVHWLRLRGAMKS